MTRTKIGFLVWLCFATILPSAHAEGVLKGRILFDGTLPASETVEVKMDTPVCGLHKESPKIILGENKGVANAVIRILGLKASSTPVRGDLDQVKCEFVPHVMALQTGASLYITSSDSVLHNAHAFYEDNSTAFNVAVPIPGSEIKKKLEKPGILRLRCDAGHTWMSAFVVVSDEPYALTDANGNFTINNIPPGTYEAEIWQEWLGKSTQSIEIKDGTNETNFLLKEKK